MRVIECRDGTRFALKALAKSVVTNLDRNRSAEARITTLPHLAHSAGADRREYLVRSETGAGRERHIDLSNFIVGYPGRADQACETTLPDGSDRARSVVHGLRHSEVGDAKPTSRE